MWRYLCGFSRQKLPEDKLYSYLHQAFYDHKKQPKIKKFFSVNFKKKDHEKPSTSRDTSVVDVKPSTTFEEQTEIPMEIDSSSFEDDFIPGTPPQDINKFLKISSKTKSKLTNEDIVQKLPKTDIISLIEGLDGEPLAKVEEKEDSFLSHFDKASKKIKVSPSDEESPDIIETSQEIVEHSLLKSHSNSVIENTASAISSEMKGSKKLISDYFQKTFKPT